MLQSKEKPIVFVIMPFNEDFFALYEHMKETFKENFSFKNAGDLDNQRNILQDIVEGIHRASVVIADLTGLNANVFYELGLAHAMNKKVIILSQDIGELPFDIKSYRANEYSLKFNKVPDLIKELEKLLQGAIDGTIHFGNPVSDYVPNYVPFIQNNTIVEDCSSSPVIIPPDEHTEDIDNGFLDYIADITENSSLMTVEITGIREDMNIMTQAVNSSTNEINRVKSQSGQTDAVFVRNICRKLSEPVLEFSEKLKVRVKNTAQYWSIVENAYLSMLDNPFIREADNVESLNQNIEVLYETQQAIHDSDEKIHSFIIILRNTIGIERRLTKAITATIRELESYLTMTGTIAASIDRIIRKATLITGQK